MVELDEELLPVVLELVEELLPVRVAYSSGRGKETAAVTGWWSVSLVGGAGGIVNVIPQ